MGDRPRRKPLGRGPGEVWPFLNTTGTTRNISPGRITKPTTPTKPIKPTAAISDMLRELHDNHRPQRSPILTRGKTAQAGTQQQQSTSMVGSSGKNRSPFLTSNTYAVLSEVDKIIIDDDDDDDEDKGDHHSVVTESSAGEAKQRNEQHKKQVPIVIPDYSGAAVFNLLSRVEDCLYEIKILRASVRVVALNRSSYEKVLTVLKESNVNYFTFDTPEKVTTKIVLTGYVSVTAAQLMEVLAEHDIRPREVRILSKKETVTGEHVLYLLLFDRGSIKIQDLRRIKSLDGFIVSWRYFSKRPSDTAQCHRCQRFGHGSRGCEMPPNCVKCGKSHLTTECELPRKANLGDGQQHKSKVECANCHGNHTANFRGCTARKRYLEELEKRKKKPATLQGTTISAAQHPINQRPAHPPGWGRTYATVTAAGGSTEPEVNANGDLFTLSEFLSLAREMFTRFRGCRNKGEQFLVLADLMGKYVTG